MTREYKSVRLEMKVATDGTRLVSGYGAVFGNVDSYGDIIMPGAFTESLAKRGLPKMLAQHDSDDILGVWQKANEDMRGLYVEGIFAKTQLGDEYYELSGMGAIDGLSIGYSVDEYEVNKEGNRILKKLTLWEVSLVTFPANQMATITNVKNAPETERDFEKFLRDAGFSRAAAKTITAHGFKALSGQRDAEDDAQRAAKRLAEFLTNLKI